VTEPTEPLDMSKDPDRFDPDAAGRSDDPVTGPLDMSDDPDRFDPDAAVEVQRRGRHGNLVDLLGDGAQVDRRDNLTWLLGLVSVLGFLALVSLLLQLR
jgi:hypothetical protein